MTSLQHINPNYQDQEILFNDGDLLLKSPFKLFISLVTISLMADITAYIHSFLNNIKCHLHCSRHYNLHHCPWGLWIIRLRNNNWTRCSHHFSNNSYNKSISRTRIVVYLQLHNLKQILIIHDLHNHKESHNLKIYPYPVTVFTRYWFLMIWLYQLEIARKFVI